VDGQCAVPYKLRWRVALRDYFGLCNIQLRRNHKIQSNLSVQTIVRAG